MFISRKHIQYMFKWSLKGPIKSYIADFIKSIKNPDPDQN